jgi:hypothetical protein
VIYPSRAQLSALATAFATAFVFAASTARAADGAAEDDLEVSTDSSVAAPRRPPPSLSAPSPSPEAALVEAIPERAPFAAPPKPGLSVSGYVQAQYEMHAESDDQLRQGGAPQNQDRFVLRRTRARLTGDWEYAQAILEIDGNTVRGPAIGFQKAEATLHYRPDPKRAPLVQATIGLFDTPFGYELVESPRARFFMERSQASRAFWPSEPDVGLRLAGSVGFARWTIAALNGNPLGTPFATQAPSSAKDVVFRFGAETHPLPGLAIGGAISALRGKGFHAGTDATKGTLEWHDQNEDGVVQPFELQAVPATAATPSQTFDHWAVGADLQIHYRSRLGLTKVYGEAVIAQNMDRGLFVADPVLTSVDARELGWNAGFTQEITRYGVVGFRYDYYDPNSDTFDKRAGRLAPASQRIKTFSPLVGLVLPGRARLVGQYDVVRNFFGRDDVGVPTNLKMNAFTLRLQVEL